MAFTQSLQKTLQSNASQSDGEILKFSALLGVAGGLCSAALYYLIAKKSGSKNQDEISILKKELIKELRQYPIDPPKDSDYSFPKEFMVTLFKLLYTYQTIGKEILKERNFQNRIQLLQLGESVKYAENIENSGGSLLEIQGEIKDVVFDYFNIITKEYEISYEKWRGDTDYQQQITDIKAQVDNDFIEKKFDVPLGLTKERTEDIVKKKQAHVNSILMKMIQGSSSKDQPMFSQKDFLLEIMKFDDQTFIDNGFRKEEVEKAIALYGFDKNQERFSATDEEIIGGGQEQETVEGAAGLRSSGKQIILQ